MTDHVWRPFLTTGLTAAGLLCAWSLAAQEAPAGEPETLTLVGCVMPSEEDPTVFSLKILPDDDDDDARAAERAAGTAGTPEAGTAGAEIPTYRAYLLFPDDNRLDVGAHAGHTVRVTGTLVSEGLNPETVLEAVPRETETNVKKAPSAGATPELVPKLSVAKLEHLAPSCDPD